MQQTDHNLSFKKVVHMGALLNKKRFNYPKEYFLHIYFVSSNKINKSEVNDLVPYWTMT